MEEKLSHTDSSGRARMVDVGHKPYQLRIASAEGYIRLQPGTIDIVRNNLLKKGDVLRIAEIAGIQAAKQTPALIPLCHPLLLSKIGVTASLEEGGVRVTSECSLTGQTGVEMEALTAVTVALLTIYDMCKAVDKTMVIEGIRLTGKSKMNIK